MWRLAASALSCMTQISWVTAGGLCSVLPMSNNRRKLICRCARGCKGAMRKISQLCLPVQSRRVPNKSPSPRDIAKTNLAGLGHLAALPEDEHAGEGEPRAFQLEFQPCIAKIQIWQTPSWLTWRVVFLVLITTRPRKESISLAFRNKLTSKVPTCCSSSGTDSV